MWWPGCQRGDPKPQHRELELTVHGLELVDDLAEGHLVTGNMSHKPWEDSTAERKFFAEICFGPSVVIKLELRWDIGIKVGVHDSERV